MLASYDRKEIYSLEEVYKFLSEKEHIFNGDPIWMNSLRYAVFHKQPCCVNCGLKGTFFAKERPINRKKEIVCERYHFNLYGINKQGKEIIFTKDHIIPRSRGGRNDNTNLQTMCGPCNWKKGSKTEEELFQETQDQLLKQKLKREKRLLALHNKRKGVI